MANSKSSQGQLKIFLNSIQLRAYARTWMCGRKMQRQSKQRWMNAEQVRV
jgi:hypothetical protein